MCQRRQNSCTRVGDVRPAEVLRKAEAEHPAEPDRHVGVAGEVEVDLQRVADDAEPRVGGRQLARAACAKMLSAGPATMLAISTFLPRPMTKRRTPYGEVVERHDPARELVGDVAVADDRSGDELRKEQQVQRRVHRALLRGRVAPVDVDDVRDGVEREERDADRQQHARHGESAGAPSDASSALTLSAKKFAYLKTPSTTRLTAIARTPEPCARGLRTPRARSTAIAIQ